jgi:hypothetical protein
MATDEDVQIKLGASLTGAPPHRGEESLLKIAAPINVSHSTISWLCSLYFVFPYIKQRRSRQSISEHHAGRES